jgi:tetratricopeptide (TPR) repeat protein
MPSKKTLSLLAISAVLSAPAYAGTVPDEAVKDADGGYFHKALALVEPLVKDHAQDAEVQFRYGQALAGVGRLDDGIAALKAAIAIDPNKGIYHRLMGETIELKAQQATSPFGMLGLAKSIPVEFQTAVQLDPSDVQAHVDLAGFYIMAPGLFGGSYSKAHAEEEIIDKLDPIQGLLVRASEAGNKGDTDDGVALLKQAIAQDKTGGSLITLGIFYTDAKRYDDAFKTFREAIAKDPKAYGAWYQIGRVAGFAKTNYAEGIDALKRYLAFDDMPDNIQTPAWAHFRLGNLYEYQGQKDLARAEYQAAGSVNAGDENLKSKLEKAMSRLE